MRWSFKIARIAGVDIRVHATFLLLLAYFFATFGAKLGFWGGVEAVIFCLSVFLCVVLHELGHSLAARRYGIATADITLWPLGGIARLERMPEKPVQELVVALAGPLVNVVIIAVLAASLWLLSLTPVSSDVAEILTYLIYANVAMLLLNLIPAFPLDGGRVLRAVLATQMNYARATRIAGAIGQGFALAIAVYAILNLHILLFLIAIFIYLGAESESALVQMRQSTAGLPVSSAMVTRFDTLDQQATLDQAVEVLLETSQHQFPVLDDNGGFAGLLTKHDLLVALRRASPGTVVRDIMITGLPAVLPQTNFHHALNLLQTSGAPALPVVDATGRLVGLFMMENVSELLLVRSAKGETGRPFADRRA